VKALVDQGVITTLAFLHVISAMAWLGAAIFFISVIGPAVRGFTPAASLEFLTKVGPRQLRFFVGSAVATLVFGLALLFSLFGTDYTLWPTSIIIGFSLGLLAFLDVALVAGPAFRKADRIARQIMNNPQAGPPSPELQKALGRGRIGATSAVIILVLALVFMTLTAYG
jgi:hypothetical protein